ncbi:hypothetical protein HMPREF1633_10235 [Tissierellia bacterium S5-A11]|nr:hypothetical protein HMPREF1633_10235 [Tissierellia bacterium S5-A11]
MKEKIKKLKQSNLMPKILSLVIAILLWFYVMNVVDPQTRRSFKNVPVRIEGLQDLRRRGLTLMNTGDIHVNLELQGNRSYMDRVNSSNIQAYINLEGLRKGEQSIPIHVTNYNDNVKVVGKDPLSVVLSIEENTSIREEVEIKTIGTLPEGYIMGDMNKSQERVTISGPKSLTDAVHSLVAYVNIKDRTQTTVLSCQLIPLDSDLEKIQGLTIEPASLEVEIPIYKTKTVPVTLNFSKAPPDQISQDLVDIQPKTATIKGNTAVLKEIEEIKTKPISWEKLQEGTLTSIELEKPQGVNLVNEKQIYQIRLKSSQFEDRTMTITEPEIRFVNVGRGLQGQILTPLHGIQIRLSADREKLNELNKDNLKFYLDCKGLSLGDHQVTIKMTPIEGVHISSIEPSKVNITLSKE